MLQIEVIGARAYSFQDDKTGRQVEGVNVFHLSQAEDAVGKIPQKITLPYETWGYIRSLPFPNTYNVVTTQVFTSKGIVSKATGIEPVKK